MSTLPGPTFRLSRGLGRLAPMLLLLLLVVSSCAPGSRNAPAEANGSFGDRVFRQAFLEIDSSFFREADFAELAKDGLLGLSKLDDTVSVRRDGDMILVSAQGKTSGLRVPTGTYAGDWARLLAGGVFRLRANSDRLKAADADEVYQAVFDGFLADLDSFSRYANPRTAERERSDREGYSGVGIILDRDTPRVLEVIPGGPAARAGVRAGYVIIAVDGVPTKDMPVEDITRVIRGQANTVVRLTFADDARTLEVAVTRARVIQPSVLANVEDGVLEIRLNRFAADTRDSVRKAVSDAVAGRRRAPLRGIIVDLRSNTGGFLNQAEDVADLFLAEGPILTMRGRRPDSQTTRSAKGGAIAGDLPMVLLVDGYTASAAEVLGAALQDAGRAVIVGTSSYGKGSVQNIVDLSNGATLYLTSARLFAPSGYTYHKTGLTPQVCTSALDEANVRRFTDELATQIRALPSDFKALQRAAGDDEVALAKVRDLCPSGRSGGSREMAVARQLLRDPAAYAKALAATGGPFRVPQRTATR